MVQVRICYMTICQGVWWEGLFFVDTVHIQSMYDLSSLLIYCVWVPKKKKLII